jgi:hypothetical protein
MRRYICLIFSLLLLVPGYARTDDHSNLPDLNGAEVLAMADHQSMELDDFGYPGVAQNEVCRQLRLLRTASDPLEIFSADGSLPACVDTNLAVFMREKSRVCGDYNCGTNYPGGCAGLLEKVFPYDERYDQIIEGCRIAGNQ